MKQYILTGESAKKFMEIKNHNEEKLKERIDNMSKIKVSKSVANFIEDYARNAFYDENWKDKLLIDHSITYNRGYEEAIERVKVLKDITPMKLAEILHNGWEIEKITYNEGNLPNYFKFKADSFDLIYTAQLDCINAEDIFIVMWEVDGVLNAKSYTVKHVIELLNDCFWIIEE